VAVAAETFLSRSKCPPSSREATSTATATSTPCDCFLEQRVYGEKQLDDGMAWGETSIASFQTKDKRAHSQLGTKVGSSKRRSSLSPSSDKT
jgi:hypothetical protein